MSLQKLEFDNAQIQELNNIIINSFRTQEQQTQPKPIQDTIKIDYTRYMSPATLKYKSHLPTKNLLLTGDSGIGKTALFQHYKQLGREQKKFVLYRTEKELLNKDFIKNEYGLWDIDESYLANILRADILLLDEFFNSKNWLSGDKACLIAIGTLIEELYHNKLRGSKQIVCLATNQRIENFITEKSIVRKFSDIFSK